MTTNPSFLPMSSSKALKYFGEDKVGILTCIEDLMFIKNNKPLFCSVCREELHLTGLERLETLNEHVSDPNQIPALKFAFKCPYNFCVANKLDWMWNSGGEWYSCGYIQERQIKWLNGFTSAIGSYQESIDIKIQKQDREIHKFKIRGCHITLRLGLNPLNWSVYLMWNKNKSSLFLLSLKTRYYQIRKRLR